MREMTITLKISSFDFTYIWNQYVKTGGKFNEFLINYYIEEIAEKFPEADMVVPKLFLTSGNLYGLSNLINPKNYRAPDRMHYGSYIEDSNQAQKLRENFFIAEDEIKNPIEVGV